MTDLTSWIAARLEQDNALSDESKLLVLAALEGDAALADLTGFNPPMQAAPNAGDGADPVGAFVRRIKVTGFRGIGPTAQLDLKPGPGLTVIAGRNGSGKSSFAEALEVALTGTTYRWRDKRSAQWGEAWRNLHAGDDVSIEVTLDEEAVGSTQVVAKWSGDASRDEPAMTLQRQGKKRQAGTDSLGWRGPLETYRPLLTYDELGSLLASEPSKLYDALSTVLGLEALAAALKRLEARSKELASPGSALATSKRLLVDALSGLEADDRAVRAAALLKSRIPDFEQLRGLATGTGDDTGVSGTLRGLLGLALPSDARVEEAAGRLLEALSAMAQAGDAATTSLELKSRIVHLALETHEQDGDGPCPICGLGALDGQWVVGARRELEEMEHQLTQLRAAQENLAAARRDARALLTPVPDLLDGQFGDPIGERVGEVRQAWTAWANAPSDDMALAEHLLGAHEDIVEALERMHATVQELSKARDDAWAAVASQVAAYASDAESWEALRPESEAAKAGLKWLKENDSLLKNERMRPIAAQAGAIWGKLRQESNVELAGITLEGSATRRHVKISAAVDGSQGAGLAVMSQGELHALALALFLPRATMPESPFRFVVLDDPVQAMDPAKVDGLVEVLAELAKSRQVVVFSHDDRLAEAVRRSRLDATILEVIRSAGSQVTVVTTVDPATRYLEDARAIISDDGLPEDTIRKVLPGLLRFAAEAQARERYFARSLGAGASHALTEATWGDAHKTAQRVSLALYGEIKTLNSWLAKTPYRQRALGICSSGPHGQVNGDLRLAYEDVKKLVDDVRSGTT